MPRGRRGAHPQRTARASTRTSPRPDSPSGQDEGADAGGRLVPAASATSIRTKCAAASRATRLSDLAILREDARKAGKRYSFEDVLLIAEVVSTSSARKDYDDCTAKYGRYGIPIYLVVDPYAQEVVLHTRPTGTGYIAAHTHKYGTGKLPIPLADGRTFTLDLDELPLPEPESDGRS
ncbi:Uma2 family endonuclease [Streptomyces nigra]|uniref:Uma2 family endonuclease n=1 Tax=Streptomyces nigra TaxID=1827580 RepID=UPI0034450CF5